MMNLSWMGGSKDGDYEEKNRVSSYKGYCYKMRRSHNMLAPQWGKRWFSIEGRFLRWYRQESDLNASGMIDLRHVRSITKVDINGSNTFCIACEDRNLIMRANSVAEMNSWYRALHIHADIARGGSGMNVVSDFNEAPLRSKNILQSSKSSKSRNSLTLEEEIDRNLRELNDLEIKVGTQSEDFVIEEKPGDNSFGEGSELGNDMPFNQPPVTYRSKATINRASNQSSNPMAEPPAAFYQRATPKVPQPKSAPVVVKTATANRHGENPMRGGGGRREEETNEKLSPTAVYSHKPTMTSRRVDRIVADGEVSDEFDQSMDSAQSPPRSHQQPVPVPRTSSTTSSSSSSRHRLGNSHGYAATHVDTFDSPSSSAEKNRNHNRNHTAVRRFQSPDGDDDDDRADSARFANVSNMSSDEQSYNYGGRNSNKPSAGLGGNHPLRNSSARAAWN